MLIIFYLEWVVIYYHFHCIYVVHLGEQACEWERRSLLTSSYSTFSSYSLVKYLIFFLSSVTFFLSFSGIFTFESASQRVSESVGVMEVKVLRTSGARGLVAVPYRTVDGTAKGGEDYELAAGKLEFQNDETM